MSVARAIAVLVAAAAAVGVPPTGADEPPAVRVEPDVPVVPSNHLKFYLHFPGPMERGEVFRHLRLVEVDGTGREIAEVPEPFREVELWDETFSRLTLWFHPGRQKPGVNLNVEIGPVLEEGRRYALEISGAWRLEAGGELRKAVRHLFAAGPFDGTQPDPRRWTVDGDGPLRIRTDDLLDPQSLRNAIALLDADGARVADAEFVPMPVPPAGSARAATTLLLDTTGLAPGAYRIRIDPSLEDLAGNSVERPFNVDLEAGAKDAQLPTLEIPVTVGPPRESPR